MKIKQLEYFLNKICTIFTTPTNRDFKTENPLTFPKPIFHYFVGRVVEISEIGLLVEQWNGDKKLKSFFFVDHIIAISEEELLDPSNPNDIEIINEYKKANEKAATEAEKKYNELRKQQNGDFNNENKDETLNIQELSNLSEKIKNDLQ